MGLILSKRKWGWVRTASIGVLLLAGISAAARGALFIIPPTPRVITAPPTMQYFSVFRNNSGTMGAMPGKFDLGTLMVALALYTDHTWFDKDSRLWWEYTGPTVHFEIDQPKDQRPVIEAALLAAIKAQSLPPPVNVNYDGDARRIGTPTRGRFLWRETARELLGWAAKPLPFVASGALFLIFIDRRKANSCPSCGYSLRGLPEDTTVCPECGGAIEMKSPDATG